MSNKIPISIIAPVYNEGSNIALFFREIEKVVKIKHEVLIIFDFDDDDTIPIVKKLQKKFNNIKLIKNSFGPGIINACKTGFLKARGDFIVVMPADLTDDPSTINNMYKEVMKGIDIVCATRYSQGGKQVGGKLLKTTLTRLAGIATPFLLGIPTSDLTNGYKMYRRNVLKKINIQSNGGWEFAMEILIKAHLSGYKITEIPSTWKERSLGQSKFKLFKWLPKYIYWYVWGIIQRINKIVNISQNSNFL